jgi:inner membrane protein
VGTALALRGAPGVAVVGLALMMSLAMVPDWDHRIPFLEHRGVTHTLAFAAVVGVVVAVLARAGADATAAMPPADAAAYGFFLGAMAVVVHLAADALTPTGVRPFWPLWGRTFTLSVTRAGNTVANYALLAMGVVATSVGLLVAMG